MPKTHKPQNITIKKAAQYTELPINKAIALNHTTKQQTKKEAKNKNRNQWPCYFLFLNLINIFRYFSTITIGVGVEK